MTKNEIIQASMSNERFMNLLKIDPRKIKSNHPIYSIGTLFDPYNETSSLFEDAFRAYNLQDPDADMPVPGRIHGELFDDPDDNQLYRITDEDEKLLFPAPGFFSELMN